MKNWFFIKLLVFVFLGFVCLGVFMFYIYVVDYVDVIVVVDELGLMFGEYLWLFGMINSLELCFFFVGVGSGVDVNWYVLVGYGKSGVGFEGCLFVGFGGMGVFGMVVGLLVIFGGIEDGYFGIDFVFDMLLGLFWVGVVVNVIFVIDEDCDNINVVFMFVLINSFFGSYNVFLNVVVNNLFLGGNLVVGNVLGISVGNFVYFVDGVGGFMLGGFVFIGNGVGMMEIDYVDLVLGIGGVVWDLNLLCVGGFMV